MPVVRRNNGAISGRRFSGGKGESLYRFRGESSARTLVRWTEVSIHWICESPETAFYTFKGYFRGHRQRTINRVVSDEVQALWTARRSSAKTLVLLAIER